MATERVPNFNSQTPRPPLETEALALTFKFTVCVLQLS